MNGNFCQTLYGTNQTKQFQVFGALSMALLEKPADQAGFIDWYIVVTNDAMV
jgi:hypothetical protein